MKTDPFHRSKMMVGLVGAGMILGAWRWAVYHLYSLPEASLPAFQSITNQCFWGVILIAGTIAGVKGLEKMMSMKTEALSAATTIAESVHERREEKIEERIFNVEKLDSKDIDEEAFTDGSN